jgi:mono/diheme cytochrome c family protein
MSTQAAGQDVTDIDRGRSIYEFGRGRDGREIGVTVQGNIPLTGAAVACAGCHGRDGRGGGEGFVRAPDIRWFSLSKPYQARRAGVAGLPYDRVSFAHALRSGLSPEGLRLDPTMPRFDLADDEVTGLVAYLDRLRDAPPSREGQPTILGLLPLPEGNTAAHSLAKKLQNCSAQDPNTHFAAIDILYFQNPEDAIAQVEQRLRITPSAVLLAPHLMGWEARYENASKRWQVPTLLPLSFLDRPGSREWYYRFPGLETQVHALLRAAKQSGRSRVRMLFEPGLSMSVMLKVVGTDVAHRYGLTVEDEAPHRSGNGVQAATLWLRPFSSERDSQALRPGELLLIPALYYVPEHVRMVIRDARGIRLRVAYPYPPRSRQDHTWRGPVDVWAEAACKVLAFLGGRAGLADLLAKVRLEWEPDLFVWAHPSEADLMEQVFLADETDVNEQE